MVLLLKLPDSFGGLNAVDSVRNQMGEWCCVGDAVQKRLQLPDMLPLL